MNNTPYLSILNYYWNAKTKYSLHSPFVFDFFNTVMNVKPSSKLISRIEEERNLLLKDKSDISFVEYGAGSRVSNGGTRRINDIAKSSLSGAWQCGVMYNLLKRYSPKTVLEIGTSLGISAAYLAAASSKASIVTLEGNPSSARIANSLFKKLDVSNVTLIEGEFGTTLPQSLASISKVDCAFIDGNHRKTATVDYFHKVRSYCHSGSFIIVDDIYWSQGMQEAWKEIVNHDSVAFSLDLFRFGIVFFDHSIMEKQQYQLIDAKWKLWSIGIFG